MIIGDTGDEIRAAVGDGSRWGVRVTYLPQDAPLGLAHCVLIARDYIGDDRRTDPSALQVGQHFDACEVDVILEVVHVESYRPLWPTLGTYHHSLFVLDREDAAPGTE